ncbi:MAG: PilC/PilY family type IV pilus protein, partial [Steroidobacteraceae bacterium]
MNVKALIAASVFIVAIAFAPASRAQLTVQEDFTNTTSDNQWFFFNGACLTAGTNPASTSSPGYLPACTNVLASYYNTRADSDPALVGGTLGYLGSSMAPSSLASQVADASGRGALRFTNGYPYGHKDTGAIVSAGPPFPTGGGVQITFKTITYLGDGGGKGGDGADGISFYLLDGCMPINGGVAGQDSGVPAYCSKATPYPNPIYGTAQTFPAIGAFGGSLAYTCSNSNPPIYDGLVGAYLGLGIDEYGNFLNGSKNTLNEVGSTTTSTYGDNTASGGLYQPGRIGLRGAGSVSWQALSTAYGTYLGSGSPYYPASMGISCTASGGNYSASAGACASCATGTLNSTNTQCTSYSCSGGASLVGTNCESCSAGTLNTGTSQCNNVCPPNTKYASGSCNTCANGLSYLKASGTSCKAGGGGLVTSLPGSVAATVVAATVSNTNPHYGATDGQNAVQNTCANGLLYNYYTGSPVSVGAATLANSANTAGILDYQAIGSTTSTGSAIGYSVLSGFNIANESATTRGAAMPIVYSLKITQDGLLSLSYSYNGGTSTPVITNQSITADNGPLPPSFRFGFAGSTGGSTNVHEIMCFKATPVQTGNGTGGVNVFQDPTLKTGAELFLASYFPSDWTGQVTATPINFDTTTNSLTLASTPTWDASCVLTGGACASTGAVSGTAEDPTSRVMLTWNGTSGIPFEYASLSAPEINALDAGDTTQTSDRLDYLRGVRTKEVNSSGVGLFRARDRVLGDIVDSSPAWIGPPGEPYASMTSWVDGIYPSATPPENSGPTYLSYQQGKQGRLNVVYVGANDGFLHGFRAGTLDSNGNLVATTTMPNDGYEVFAYMPGVVLNTIHPSTTTGGVTTVNTALDYSNTQYSHAYFVDATPATGDLYYGGAWHTWVVGGLGAGGSAVYALDVSDPSVFTETNAAKIVIGEWTPGTLTCADGSACGVSMGNTYGTPEIRRFHSGDWGIVFGNGFGALDSKGNPGAAGVYIMLINHTSGTPSFYYLQATAAASGAQPNGIASPTSLDVDLDHIVDYIYA